MGVGIGWKVVVISVVIQDFQGLVMIVVELQHLLNNKYDGNVYLS